MIENIGEEGQCEHASLRLMHAAIAYLDHPEIPQNKKIYYALMRAELAQPLIAQLCCEELYEPEQYGQLLALLQNV
jgi:hypothetical protein